MEGETPAKNHIIIELHVPNFQKAKEFYTKLGFEVVWERKPEEFKGYLVLKKGNNILCFWGGNEKIFEHPYLKKYPRDTKRGYGVEIIVMVDYIEKYYKKVKDFANVVEKLQISPWGLKDFRIEDPFGFYIRFTSKHNVLDSKYTVK